MDTKYWESKERQGDKLLRNFKKGPSVIGVAAMLVATSLPKSLIVEAGEVTNYASTILSSHISANSFIEDIGEQARTVAAANDLYASVMIAQAVLESGWGTSRLSQAPHYNLYGVKWSGSGAYSEWLTKEVFKGKWVTITDKFQKYASHWESLQDNADLLRNRSFQSGVYFYRGTWKSNTNSYQDATAWLTGRYATDPGYATKLNAVIISNNLTRFDTPASGVSHSGDVSNTANGASYTVSSQDTLFSIAQKNGVSVADLKAWNNLSSDRISAGQLLVVSRSSGVSSMDFSGSAYTVSLGETLYSVARKNGVSVTELKTWNNLSDDRIKAGQLLQVAGTGSQSNPSTGDSYTVSVGETLYSVAQKTGSSVTDLKSWNNLASDSISAGQILSVSIEGSGSSPSTGGYTVSAGETLYSVAQKNGVSQSELKAWNNLANETIAVGQTLVVSHKDQVDSSNNQTYKVVSGDTLWGIANKHNISAEQLSLWNELQNEVVSVGQTLRVQ